MTANYGYMVKNHLRKHQHIKKGVRHGCVMSPDLVLLYIEPIMRPIENMPWILAGGHNINN